ncbi:MAG: bifunctional phosphopantothenoylcysteine decarboxylase/phosphopantothenate--cysteine ligase CoaBC [Gammaproteobacteria bacterium]|jgi:phosphopantothenoylcysteine decarboxylase/phosphopantothenate--cysteine ligase|nr:bifunctional phosphopantothenoylcysteine decarboxylase/phosphopantothenate--cysteine ligase CoaBC [Gammaproteobacteria bacterium]
MTEQTPLDGKKIVLGVTGSIAAYKAADLVRLLIKEGAEVKVVMTQAASEFITPLTMQTLSGSPVAMTLLDADEESTMGHIQLARWADWVLIAPASANTLAGLAHGRTEDLLTALCLATTAPIAVAPAMNNKMWSNEATQNNLATIADRGVLVLGPATGEQACGEHGEGRLLEPEQLITELLHLILPTKLSGKRVVVTAGPTHEPIDPVRFIGNRSSGKMGFAIATAAAQAGAEVILITGPVALATPPEVQRVDVETAQQMFEAIEKIEQIDIFIGCAAVADYRPEQYSESKLKKAVETQRAIQVTENKDIIAAVAQRQVKPFIVGFAAETDDIINYAKDKMERKQLDMIAANLVGKGLGFGVDTNTLYVFWQQGEALLPLALKSHLARDLMRLIIDRYDAKNSA